MRAQKYKAAFLIGLQNSLEYRFDFFTTILSTLFPILIQIYLWSALYNGGGNDTMYGYSFPEMLVYVCTAGTVSKFMATGIETIVNSDIHTGYLSTFLTKPVNYVLFRFLQTLGRKIFEGIVVFALSFIVIGVLSFFVGLNISVFSILLFIPVLCLSVLLNFFLFFAVSISAFWLTEVGRFFHAMNVVVSVLSGGVFPIAIFGERYVQLSAYSPFQYTSYFAINVITGSLDLRSIAKGMGIQLIWIMILVILTYRLWNAGLRKYIAVGG